MIVAIAFSAGVVVPPRAVEYMSLGTVVVPAVDDMYWVTTKSSIDSANTISRLATIAGISSGTSTRRSACTGVAPRSRAASSYWLPIDDRRPRMITTTYDTEKVTWPTVWATVPRWIRLNGISDSCVNTTSRDTATR